MSEEKVHMCLMFEDQPCPRGKEAADECSVRVNGDFDPMIGFKDLLVMHCALYRAEQAREDNTENETKANNE